MTSQEIKAMKNAVRSPRVRDLPVPNGRVRVAGVLLAVATVWYLWWLLGHIDLQVSWLSIPFALASVIAAAMFGLTLVNQWSLAKPLPVSLPSGTGPDVAVIIPTLGEPPQMVEKTARSVLDQDYPLRRIHLVVSDDAHSKHMRAMVEALQTRYPETKLIYHSPPRRGDPRRRGEAKAGNLNSVLDVLDAYSPGVQYVETRDADDMLERSDFLRQTVGQLMIRSDAAFVQTMKDAKVAAGDPFGNRERFFYQRLMLAKHAANAVFPCGSGLVWRRSALQDIGGFPSWNLVEDLQSGVEALRKGWRSIYLPIVGAVSQAPPEDLPNVIKQRGTWAIDTMRLLLWGHLGGMRPRQYLQFAEMGVFYCLSFAFLVFAITPSLSLIANRFPVAASGADYALHFAPYLVATELWLVALFGEVPYRDLWRSRQMWTGLAPVYARATLLAVSFGPKRKPSYRVTRKENIYRWYWRQIVPQIAIAVLFVLGVAYHLFSRGQSSVTLWQGLAWGGLWLILFGHVIQASWHGIAPAEPDLLGGMADSQFAPAKSLARADNRLSRDYARADALYRLSRRQLQLGEAEEAVYGLQEVLRVWPDREDVREALQEARRQLPEMPAKHPPHRTDPHPGASGRRWRVVISILAIAAILAAAAWLVYTFLILPLWATPDSSSVHLLPVAFMGLDSRVGHMSGREVAMWAEHGLCSADASSSVCLRAHSWASAGLVASARPSKLERQL